MKINDYYYDEASGVWCHEITDHMTFNVGSCFKYLFRGGRKTQCPLSDWNKALDYAKQATENDGDVFVGLSRKIKLLADCRSSYVRKAMIFISQGMFEEAASNISSAIKEQSND